MKCCGLTLDDWKYCDPMHLRIWSLLLQEYERAVIFRLGRLLKSGARGPGVFFIIPCIDHYEKIDMRTQTYDVPPQEVLIYLARITRWSKTLILLQILTKDSVTVFVNAIMYYKVKMHQVDADIDHLLQGEGRHLCGGERRRLQRLCSATGCDNLEEHKLSMFWTFWALIFF